MEEKQKITLTEEQENYIKGFSWECVLAGFWWPVFNELWVYAIGMLVPILNIVIWTYLCIRGRKIAFENKNWLSFAQYKDRQNITLVIGILKVLLAFFMFAFALILFFVFFDVLVELIKYLLSLFSY